MTVWVVLISTAGAVTAGALGALLTGRGNQKQLAAEAKLERQRDARDALAKLLAAAEMIEAQTLGALTSGRGFTLSSELARELLAARSRARLVMEPDQFHPIDAYINALNIRANALNLNAGSHHRESAQQALNEQGLGDGNRLDRLREGFVDAARTAIANA